MRYETNTLQKTNKDNQRREIVIILLAVLLLISLSLLVVNKYIFINGGIVEPQLVIPESNGHVFDGMLPTDNPDEVLALLQEKVDENQFAFRINANPVFTADCKSGNLRIENPARNIYCMQAELILDETGEILYSSPLIRPNQHIEHVGLARQLKSGNYAATVRFIAIHPDTNAYMGEVAAAISLSVGK
jgi:hypothetical protein